MKKLTVFIWFLMLEILPLQAATILQDTFPSPANSLSNSMILNSGSQINGTTSNTIVTKSWTNNGALCDGAPCVMSNTLALPYSFTMDVGTGVDGWGAVNTTYTSDKQFEGINLNVGDTVTFTNDITIKMKNNFNISGTLNINGNVTIHVPSFTQNSGSTLNVSSGSLTIIADNIILNHANTTSPTELLCLANSQLILNSGVKIKALLYTNGTMYLNDNCVVDGAATASSLTMNANATINYSLGVVVTQIISGAIYDSSTSASIANASIILYKDDGDGQPDAGDVLADNTTTDATGYYSFNVADGSYFVIVDSTSLHSDPIVWMEQSHGSVGAFCADGSGGTTIRGSQGTCFGGKNGALADDLTSISTVEHIAFVDINGSNVNNISFGFSSNVVSNINDSGQGSLRQFIQNANTISGANMMKFVPSVPKNSANWWTITLASALPTLTDDGTTVDGTAYYFDGTIRDANGGTVGHGGTSVGTGADALEGTSDEAILPDYKKPELEIDANDYLNSTSKIGIFVIQSNTNVVKHVAIYNGDESSTDYYSSAILIDSGADNVVTQNFLGCRADGSEPNVGEKIRSAIYQNTTGATEVTNNYIAYPVYEGIWAGDNAHIAYNEFYNVATRDKGDAITTEFSSGNQILIEKNRIEGSAAYGIESWNSPSIVKIENNTIIANGLKSSVSGEEGGIRVFGENCVIENNIIKDHVNAGIVITGAKSGNLISKNSIYQNGGLSIDFDSTLTGNPNGDGVTANNGTKDSAKPNSDMDFPIFTKANLTGTTLHVEGYVGSNANQSTFAGVAVEIYKVDDDGDSNGEGRYYLGSCISDASGNIDCDITTSLLADGDFITATATDTNNNTSEFGPNKLVSTAVPFVCSHEAYVFYSDTENQPTQVNKIDLMNESSTNLSTNIHSTNINAIGYNVVDNMIWGYDMVNHTVTKTDKNLTSKIYNIAGLDPYGFHLGDVSSDGILYLASAYLNTEDGVETDGILRLYRVDVKPDVPVKLSEIALTNQSLYGADFAFHPIDKMLYMVEKTSGDLYKIDPDNGAVTNVGNTGFDYADSQVQFFDKNGYFYFFKDNVFYRIDLTDPANPNSLAVKFIDMVLPSNGDGARCANSSMGDQPILMMDVERRVLEGHTGTKDVVFTITADRAVTDPAGVTVNYNTSDGSALAGLDYIGTSGSITIPQGSTTADIVVKINGDSIIEHPHETFYLNVSSPTSKVINTSPTCLIINDDFDIELRVVDPTVNYDWNGSVSTQIVNKTFGLTVLAYNHTLGTPAADMNITKVVLKTTTLWNGPPQTTGADGIVSNIPLTIDYANPNASLQIFGTYMDAIYDSTTSDYFAVRPDHYEIEVPLTPQKAGENFNLKIKAVDAQFDLPALDYNETNTSFNLQYKVFDPTNCIKGQIIMPNIQFQNGVADFNLNYSEVGRIEFNISEITGSEFAKIDVNDTSVSDRQIDENSSEIMTFFPHQLQVLPWTLRDDPSYPILFYADINSVQDMGAELNVTIRAVQSDGTTLTQNYKSGCFAKDTNLTVYYDLNSADTQELIWKDMKDASYTGVEPGITSGDNNFTYNIDQSKFINGETNASLKINFTRFRNKTKEPLSFRVTDVNATDYNNITGNKLATSQPELDFYYGRLHAPRYTVVGADLDAIVFYEVFCKDCDKSKFIYAGKNESENSVYWYILDNNIQAFNNTQSRNDVTINHVNNSVIKLTAPKTPYMDKITYTPKPWLLYNRFSSSTATHNFNVDFSSQATTWAGKGNVGKTVDSNISKRILKKMDW